MAEAHVQRAGSGAPASRRLDIVLTTTVTILVLAVLGVAAYFGWTIYRDRLGAEDATPALRAAKVLREQVKKNPNDATLRVRYGEALASAGKNQDAIAQFNAALKIDGKHTGAYLDLGVVAMNSEHLAEATKYFKKVLELTEGQEYESINQRRELALYNLGQISLGTKQYEEAAGYFKGALRIRKDASDTYYGLALALQGMEEPDEAMRQLETALAFDPSYAQAHFLMGQLYLEDGDKVNGSYHLHEATRIAPDAAPPREALAALGTPEEWQGKAKKALAAGDFKTAVSSILIARNIDPENASSAVLHAQILVKRGALKDALDVYKQAAKLDPKDAAVKAAIKKLKKQIGSKKASS